MAAGDGNGALVQRGRELAGGEPAAPTAPQSCLCAPSAPERPAGRDGAGGGGHGSSCGASPEPGRGGKARLCRAAAAAPGAAGGGYTPGAAPPAGGGGGGLGTSLAWLFLQPFPVSSCCSQRDATAAA